MTASIAALTQVSSLLGWQTTASASDPTNALIGTSTMPAWSSVRGDVLTAVSTKLGMSQADLAKQLRSGKSMADVATAAGVNSEDLNATIQSSLASSGLPAGVNFAVMASRMANNVNNASIEDAAAAPVTTPTAPAAAAATPKLGIDTSGIGDIKIGGLMLDSGEVSVLLGTSRPSLDTYL